MASHSAGCKCASCRKVRRAQHIRRYYSSLPPDKRHTLSAKRRATAYGVRSEPYSRTAIFKRWNWECAYGCGGRAVHLDHVVPLSKGGEDVESNVIPVCQSANLRKGAKTLAEWCLADPNIREIEE